MDIKQLQFLCALERLGHFGKAADACCVTQPTLSMRLRNLEEELGVTLIKRKQRFEGFTPEGERLLQWAKQTISAFDGLKSEAARLKGSLVGTLRIGIVPLSHVHLMPVLKALSEQSPQLRFQLHSLSSEQIIEQLTSNHLDVGLTYLAQVESERFIVHPLGQPDIGLLYHPEYFHFDQDSNLPAPHRLPWSALANIPLGLLSPAMRFRQGIDRTASVKGVTLTPLIESDAVEHLIEAANEGLCCTLVPLPVLNSPMLDHLMIAPMETALPQPALAAVSCRNQSTPNGLALALLQMLKTAY